MIATKTKIIIVTKIMFTFETENFFIISLFAVDGLIKIIHAYLLQKKLLRPVSFCFLQDNLGFAQCFEYAGVLSWTY